MSNKHSIHRAARDRAVFALLELREQAGELTLGDYRLAAESSGYSVRQLRRQLAARDRSCSEVGAAGEPSRFVVDEYVANALFDATGNIAKAYRRLQRDGRTLPSVSTFRRTVIEQIGPQARRHAKTGSAGVRSQLVHLHRVPDDRGFAYLMDHTELPIYVIPDGHKTAVRPWITGVMDSGTRYLLGWTVTFGRPSAEQVRSALMSAITLRYAPDGVTWVGGGPKHVYWDRGLEFLGDLVTQSGARLGFAGQALPAYSPHLKGALERFWHFLKQDALSHLPGYIDAGHDLRGNLLLAKSALTESAFLLELATWMDGYNQHHVNRSLGVSPLQAWQADERPLWVIPTDRLWTDFLISKHKHKVGSSGIRFARTDYVCPDGKLNGVFGQQVEVRHLPHDHTFIEVFHNGQHLTTCYPSESLQPDEMTAFLQARQRDRADATARFTSANRLRQQHPDARPLTKVTDSRRKTSYRVAESSALDLFADPSDTLKALGKLPEDTGQGRLL